jgi:hypothetical protein
MPSTKGNEVRTKRHSLLFLCSFAAVFLIGCQEDEIRHYQVPKPETPTPADQAKVRLLAAIIPQGDNTWFFKLAGPAQQVEEHADAFQRFVQSVRFRNESRNPIDWKVPEGWRVQGGSGLGRYATFRLGPKDRPLELRVNRFGREAGTLLDNVNRWRHLDLGLPKITEQELGAVTRKLEVNGVAVTLVEMTGPGNRKAGMGQ